MENVTINELTPEQLASLEAKKEYFINLFLNDAKINKEKAESVIKFVYELIDLPMPKVHYVISPFAAQELANELNNTVKEYYQTGTYLTLDYASFYAFYETFKDFGIVTEEKCPKYFRLRDFIDSNIYSTIEFDTDIIVCEKPIFVKRNGENLHATDGPAIKWADGYSQYYINGRNYSKDLYDKFENGLLTKEDFINESNEDTKAVMYELIESKGEGSMLTFLGAKACDTRMQVHSNGEIEELTLYKTDEEYEGEEDLNGKSPAQLAWIKFVCPSTYSTYLIPTDSSFTNAIDAAKYHRDEIIPTDLDYKWDARS